MVVKTCVTCKFYRGWRPFKHAVCVHPTVTEEHVDVVTGKIRRYEVWPESARGEHGDCGLDGNLWVGVNGDQAAPPPKRALRGK